MVYLKHASRAFKKTNFLDDIFTIILKQGLKYLAYVP